MATTNSLPFEDELQPTAGGLKDRLKNLWGRSRGAIAMKNGHSRNNRAEAAESFRVVEQGTREIVAVEGFRVEALKLSTGWRVNSINESTGVAHEFYVHEGIIYHVRLWNHSTQFVVGNCVMRIMDSEKQAILYAVGHRVPGNRGR